MILPLLGILWHGFGLFFLPFLLGLMAALFLEVGEVGDTWGIMLGLSAVVIAPAWLAQMLGIALKTSRELRLLRARRKVTAEIFVEVLYKHMRIVTPRGWAVLAMGTFAIFLALALKWADFSIIGVMALLMFYALLGISSLLSTVLIASFQSGMKRGVIKREVIPAVVNGGDPAEERFTFERVPVPPGYFLLVEDHLPVRLATVSRYAVGAGAKRQLVVGGRLRRSPRGLYQLGPAEIYYQDVFGFTRLAVASLATAELKVLPRFRNLVVVEPPQSRSQSPDVLTRPHRFPTEDWFRFRDYAPGDDTRRIQWKLSVKAGRLQVRQPETKEITTRNVLLALDTYLPGQVLEDAIGVEEVLDQIVETWISLARDLVEQGHKVSLAAVSRNSKGEIQLEHLPCAKGGQLRWQDIGARVFWQARHEVTELIDAVEKGAHAMVVTSRFQSPPPVPFQGQSLTWVFLPPQDALKEKDPSILDILAGPTTQDKLLWALRLPGTAGSDENALLFRLRSFLFQYRKLEARQRLRQVAKRNGDRTLNELIRRGDIVYRLEPGVHTHKLVGVSAGTLKGVAR